MTYSSGNTILATDYNGFVGTVNTVIGNSASYQSTTGYGQSTLSTVSSSGTVNASSWASLITAVKTAATHQGSTINLPASNPTTGDTIDFVLAGSGASFTAGKLRAWAVMMDISDQGDMAANEVARDALA